MSPVADDFPPDVPDRPELVSLEREADLATLTIRRPEVMNCLSFPTLRRFRTLCEELRDDLSVRCVVVTGEGERAFCAGADLKERRTMPDERVPHFVRNIRALMDDVAALPQPTIAAINGHAFGGGTELALACDLRVAAAGVQLGLTEVSLAIIPGAGGTQRLPRLVGPARAKELILTAGRVDAEEAERIGLVNRAVPRAALREAVLELAGSIAANGPIAVRAAKDAIDGGTDLPLEQGLEHEARCYERTLGTKDRLEALAAFAEKRPPRYRGE